MSALLAVRGLRVEYAVRAGALGRRRATIRAVDGVDLAIEPGETLGLVGESGCGKTTLGNAVLGIVRPTGGTVVFEGTDLAGLDADGLRRARRHMQMIFQDPDASLNPRMRVGDSIGEPLLVRGSSAAPRSVPASRACWSRSASTRRSTRGIPTSSRAVSASGSGSRAPSPSSPGSSCATSPCRPSTCRCAPRS